MIKVLVTMAALVGVSANAAPVTRTPGPSNYHQTYQNISQTTVTIDGLTLRTDNGLAIPVDLKGIVTLDLQKTVAIGDGIQFDTSNVQFPQGVDVLNVVEVEARISGQRYPFILFNGTSECRLGTPHKLLNFYSLPNVNGGRGFEVLRDNSVYLIKLNYSALNAIQLDMVTVSIQDGEPCDCIDPHIGNKKCIPNKPRRAAPVLRCELVNRRIPVTNIVRKVDER